MSAVLRDYEDIQWFIFRYTNLPLMRYSELGNHCIGSAKTLLTDEALRLQVEVTAGKVNDKKAPNGTWHVANVAFPRMVARSGEGYLHGPKELDKIADTPLNRAKLYINLVAYLADFPRDPDEVKLNLWVPPTYAEHSKLLQAAHDAHEPKYKFRPPKEEDFIALEVTPMLLQVKYNWLLIDKWLAYARRHPDYCRSVAWEYQEVDFLR